MKCLTKWNHFASSNTSPLYIVSQNGQTDTVALLLQANADPNLKLGDGKTPLYIANRYSHTEIVTLLLNAGADPAGISAPLGYTTSLDDPFAED